MHGSSDAAVAMIWRHTIGIPQAPWCEASDHFGITGRHEHQSRTCLGSARCAIHARGCRHQAEESGKRTEGRAEDRGKEAMTMTMPGLATSTMSGIASEGIHAVPVACLDAGPPTLRPGLCKRTPAASDSSQCLDALRWCGAGMAWNASEADSVRQHVNERVRLAGAPPRSFSQEEAARMLLRARAGSETAPEVTAVPFPPKLYMDPVLRSRRGVLVRFLRRFRALFFVRKKGDKQRMITDARAVNDRFRLHPAGDADDLP